MGFLGTFLGRLFGSPASRELLPLGSRAPDFALLDHRGQTVRLEDYSGGRFVLWFFPKASTPGCTRQGCGYRDRIREYEEKGVRVLAASFDSVEANRRFAEEQRFPFPILCDVDRRLGLSYRAALRASDAYPRRITYVIGPEGLIEQALETKDPGAQAGALLETF
ncbi:MAG: peroxiredoxin [Planctomycetota bacterium]|nr:peroxiredoxin [Planctomycetota bacterium]